MRAFFNRFKSTTSVKDQPIKQTRDVEEKQSLHSVHEWPPRPTSTASVNKPLPDLRPTNLELNTSLPPLPSLPTPTPTQDKQSQPSTAPSTLHQQDGPGRKARKASGSSTAPSGDVQKKVAFISPPQTPADPIPIDTVLSSDARRKANNSDPLPHKNHVAKLVALHDGRPSTSSVQSNPPVTRINTTAAAKAPASKTAPSPTQSSTRFHSSTVPTAPLDAASIHVPPSLRAGTPFSQMSQRSGLLTTASWSEAAEEDLVSNIGQRERTRQEVLWEIVASEERYVLELIKMKETFIDPLLHPFAPNPLTSLGDEDHFRTDSPAESVDHLPIASKFLSSSIRSETPATSGYVPALLPSQRAFTPMIPTPDNDSLETDDDDDRLGGHHPNGRISAAAKAAHPRSPYGTAARSAGMNPRTGKPILPYPSRSHHSLPPPARSAAVGAISATSLGRDAFGAHNQKKETGRVLKKVKRNTMQVPPESKSLAPHLIPEDLKRCLEVIESGIIIGHVQLSEALRKRYEEQYPLVRSLADVFVTNSIILNEYATYVLHLERALEQIGNALSAGSIMQRPRKPETGDWAKVCKQLQKLEEVAAEKGETGLAISLSKPFQRLLKYPLLFQNLLFHTDPSTFEYESTLQMVAEVESIVRSIEDEKIQKEERDKTRDIFARIDGLEKDKILAIFKPSRLLIEERLLDAPSFDPSTKGAPPSAMNGAVSPTGNPKDKGLTKKSSFRRISEVLHPGQDKSIGGKKDLWLVVFNDVVLRCQRTGITSLPLTASSGSRTTSMPEKESKNKQGTAGRRAQGRTRNLYKFLKVESWTINQKPSTREVVSKEDIERSRTHLANGGADDETDDGEIDSDDSDRKSKMSFSYWGADKVTLSKPTTPRRNTPTSGRPTPRLKPQTPSSFAGRSSAKDAKFGSRLRSPEPSTVETSTTPRPGSRRTQVISPVPVPVARRGHGVSDDSKMHGNVTSVGAPVSKPVRDGSTRAASTTPSTAPSRRPRNLSQTSGQPGRVINGKTVSSPAPSEDSGVGMYRRIVAQDPDHS